MRMVDEILEQAKHLSRHERRELAEKLEDMLDPSDNEEAGVEAESDRLAALDSFLKLAGTGHSEFTDVSKHKGKHLAEVYAPRRESK